VLIAIAHLASEGDVNVKTVADHLHLSGAFITTTTRRLLQSGLILKTIDQTDRRRVTLTVSQKGRAALEKLAPVQQRLNDIEFGGLSREEFKLLNNIVRRLIDHSSRAVALQNYLLAGGMVAD
ncbi:MAG: MarR family winged helix-turn-helix transcriptional regulator, partial [Bradyrhizobium sp.]